MRDFSLMDIDYFQEEECPSHRVQFYFSIAQVHASLDHTEKRRALAVIGAWCLEQFGEPAFGRMILGINHGPAHKFAHFEDILDPAWMISSTGGYHFAIQFNDATWATAFRLRWC